MPIASTRSWSCLSQSTGPPRKRPLGAVSGACEDLRAGVQRLPVRQAGAQLFDIGRIPPVLARLGVVGGGVDDAALVHHLLEGCAERALPDLVHQVNVALAHGGVDDLAVGGHVFGLVARLVEQLADDVGADDLARPVVQRNLDRVRRLGMDGRGQQCAAGEHDRQRASQIG
jgi:hypothetical protein